MARNIFLLFLVIPGILLFRQNDYTLVFERMERVKHNATLVCNFNVVTFKYNRTNAATNATFTYLQDLNYDIEVIVQAYTFLSNEYRLFPMRFQFNYCAFSSRNEFGLEGFTTCGNFTKCPIKKGTYHLCNWIPDGARFPPYLPNGRYMFNLSISYLSNELMDLRLYAEVSRPIYQSKKYTIPK